jgi:ABC-type glycerol-3-phosphate transport system permease component
MRKRSSELAIGLLINAFLLVLAFISLYPLAIMIFGSLKTTPEMAANPAGMALNPTLRNFRYLLIDYTNGTFTRSFFNSLFISSVYTLLSVLISALAAYAFSKCRFRGRNLIFALLLGTMIFPAELTIPPLYILFSKIHWLDTYYVQIFPGLANVFTLFMIKQYMQSVPVSLIESARIDGARHVRIFFSIMVPVCMPIISVTVILNFLDKFNDYLFPAIMVNKPQFMPVMTVLPSITSVTDSTSFSPPYQYLMAGCSIITIPIIVAFILFRKSFIQGVSLGAGIKE